MNDPDIMLKTALASLKYNNVTVPVTSLPCDPNGAVYCGYNMTLDADELPATNHPLRHKTQYYVHVYAQSRAVMMDVYRSVRALLNAAGIKVGAGGPEGYDSVTGYHQTQVIALITQKV